MEDEASRQQGPDSKGKGKDDARSNTDHGLDHGAAEKKDPGTSLPWMAQSAASFLLSGPPGAVLGGGDGKAESSRAGEALARAGESSIQMRSNIAAGESLKMGQTQEHIAREEASFAAFLDSGNAPMLSEPNDDLEGAWRSAVPSAPTSGTAGAAEPFTRSVAEQQAKDGADVVALLSSDGGLEQVFDNANEPASQGDLAALRKALFGQETDQGETSIPWDNVLNFIPEYLQSQTAPRITPADSLAMHLGTTDANEAWQLWVTQWSRVLTSYQDEVWGDLSALVDEARAEVRQIEEVEPGEPLPEPKALLRLRAILGHLRGAH
ncbi:uncharacterized protein B0T15DRAFT_518058 [Chaetomium strumarium]|uniref:Uncharacterized protein n=1 Tax=Chaetomium strumarium TaxID=1170767 RepID=A0AAJ0M680_9PEZI|nr:hypothetical protein B0T15DRAFT_518058 [Chaetomium strumarium]